MNSYKKTFEELAKKNGKAFIPFIVLGDPDFGVSKRILETMVQHSDCLEVGFPFSDPIADGKRIQCADQRALESNITPMQCFELIAYAHSLCPEKPIGILVYYNLIYSMGTEKFLANAKKSGATGILVADMPLEESGEFNKLCRQNGLDQIFIAAPTTSNERLAEIMGSAGGFIYLVSVLGVTGERKSFAEETFALIKRIKGASRLPVCVGFGVSTPENAKKICEAGADGFIVGSALEAIVENNLENENKMIAELEEFLKKMKGVSK